MNDMNCEKCWRSSVLLLKYIIFFHFALLRRAWTISPLSYWKKNSGEAGSISHHSVHNYSSNSTTIQLMTVRVGLAFTGGRPACAMGSSLWSLFPTVLFKEPLSKLSGHGIGRTMAIWRVYMGIPYCLFGHIQTSSGYVSNSIQFRSDLWNRLK